MRATNTESRPDGLGRAVAFPANPIVQEAGEEEEGEEEAEERLVPRCMRSPSEPSMAEREAHMATHLPFRSWCKFCVQGRAENPPHQKSENEEVNTPEIQMDYCFTRKEHEEENITILVVKDRNSKVIMPSVVQTKGRGADDAVEAVVKCVRRLGHRGQLTLKVDNENSLLDLREAVMAALQQTCTPLRPPAYAHQSNGAVENGVKLVKGLLRVHLAALEEKIGASIPSRHPVVAWLVEHIGDLMTKYTIGKDGKTPYERLLGRKLREEALNFVELVYYRRKQLHLGDLDGRWEEGIWAGRRWGSITNLILTPAGALEARAIRRKPNCEKWSAKAIEQVKATPWRWVPAADSAAVVLPPLPDAQVPLREPHVASSAPPVPRMTYITNDDLRRFGYTSNCRRCMRMRAGNSVKGMAHTPACRVRVEAAMAAEGDSRVFRAQERRKVYEEQCQPEQEEQPEENPPQEMSQQQAPRESQLPQPPDGQGDPQGEAATPGRRDNAGPSAGPPAGAQSLTRGTQAWMRTDYKATRFYTTMSRKGAPAWETVTHRTTIDTVSGMLLEDCVPVKGQPHATVTRLLPHRCATRTIFYYDPPAEAQPAEGVRDERVQLQEGQEEASAQQHTLQMLASLVRSQKHIEVPAKVVREASAVYELLLVRGVDDQDAARTLVELYSPPRITNVLGLPRPGSLAPGATYDLICDKEGRSWDFTKWEHRVRARAEIAVLSPYIVVGSPPCTMFSILQALNTAKTPPEVWRRRMAVAMTHLQFCVQVYRDQLNRGAHFLHEHPASAGSWYTQCMRELVADPRVTTTISDQCQYGLRLHDASGREGPAMKTTMWATSAQEVARVLSARCPNPRTHGHVVIMGGAMSRAAAVYPTALCHAIALGVNRQLERESAGAPKYILQRLNKGTAVIDPDMLQTASAAELLNLEAQRQALQVEVGEARVKDEEEECNKWAGRLREDVSGGGIPRSEACEKEPARRIQPKKQQRFWDDVSGEELPEAEVREARKEELQFMNEWDGGVWEVVPIEDCIRKTGKMPIGGRWVDHNKGDTRNLNVRSRWVAQEMARGHSDDFFAATPPLEALRMLLSDSATRNPGDPEKKLMYIDVRKAARICPTSSPAGSPRILCQTAKMFVRYTGRPETVGVLVHEQAFELRVSQRDCQRLVLLASGEGPKVRRAWRRFHIPGHPGAVVVGTAAHARSIPVQNRRRDGRG